MSARRFRFVSSRGHYVRGGIAIGTGVSPTLVPVGEVSAEALRKIAADPNVEIAVEMERDRFFRLARAELDIAIEAGLRLTGERADVATGGAFVGSATGPIDIVSQTGEALPPTMEQLIAGLVIRDPDGPDAPIGTEAPPAVLPTPITGEPEQVDGASLASPAVDPVGAEGGVAAPASVGVAGGEVAPAAETATVADPVPAPAARPRRRG